MSWLQPHRSGDQFGVMLRHRGQEIYFYFDNEAGAQKFYDEFRTMLDSKHPELVWSNDLRSTVASALDTSGPGIDLN